MAALYIFVRGRCPPFAAVASEDEDEGIKARFDWLLGYSSAPLMALAGNSCASRAAD